MPYLDKDGLTTLWAKVKSTFALKSHSHTASDLPTATTSQKGIVQVGDGLSITSAGVLSATGGGSGGAVSGVKGNAETSYRTGQVNLTPANIGAIPTTGGTATGNLTIERSASGDTALFARNTASGKAVYFGIGSGTYNRGVFDVTGGQWLIYSDTNDDVHVASHAHAAGDITSGTLSAARGGTGQTTLQATRNAMGLGNTTGALPIANGGTGATTAANARSNLGITPANIGAAVAPTSLYKNTSGTTGSFTLSSSIANFSVIEVFFKTNDGCAGCQKAYNNYSSTAYIDITVVHPTSSTTTSYMKFAQLNISGTSASVANIREIALWSSDHESYSSSNSIQITRVVGWKY